MRESAVQYTDDLLAHVEDVVAHYLNSSNGHYQALMDSLTECYETVRANRAELRPQEIEAVHLSDTMMGEVPPATLDII